MTDRSEDWYDTVFNKDQLPGKLTVAQIAELTRRLRTLEENLAVLLVAVRAHGIEIPAYATIADIVEEQK